MSEGYGGHEHADALPGQMDISSELANQAAAAEAVAAAVAAQEIERERDQTETSAASGAGHGHAQQHGSGGTPHTASAADLPQPGQGPPPPPAYQRSRPASGASASPLPFQFGPPHRQAPDSPLSNSQQLMVLREFYARNPNPSKKEYEMLAERTGRPWNKIREYFRQRRNKLRGLGDFEAMEEPGRATSWLQVTYRPGPATASVSQLSLYNAYKTRFDPYAATAPLLGGQELIQLACSTFPGCEMARDDGDYVLRGLRDKEGVAEAEWDRSVDALVEPLRGATWLLSNFQHQADGSAQPSLSQTELYTAYATRFSSLLPENDGLEAANGGSEAQAQPVDAQAQAPEAPPDDAELKDFEANMGDDMTADDINSFLPPAPGSEADGEGAGGAAAGTSATGGAVAETQARPARLLNPVELIALARMTFPKCEPAVDEDGRFVIRGIERREAVERGRSVKPQDMFPFALANAPAPSDSAHPFTSLLKRKLALLNADADEPAAKRREGSAPTSSASPHVATGIGVNIGAVHPEQPDDLPDEDRELLEGLKRFRHSKLGREVRDVCVQQ